MPILNSMRRSEATSGLRLEGALNLKGTLGRLQSALELHQKCIANRFDFRAVEARKNGSQNSAMLLQQFEGERFVALGERGVADHVGKHDGG